MKIIGLNMNTSVLTGGMPEAYACLKNCLQVLSATKVLSDSLRDWESSSNVPLDVYSDTQLVNCEQLLSVLKTSGIDNYKFGSLSRYPVLFERLEHFQFYRDQINTILDEIVDAYINLSTEEIEQLRILCQRILEQLIYFTYFEYNFDATLLSVVEEREIEVNEALDFYCGKEGESVEKITIQVSELYSQYKPTIPSMELDEDTIDNFYHIAGIYSYSILENIDSLEMQDIIDIAAERVTVEDVVAKISGNRDGGSGVQGLDLF